MTYDQSYLQPNSIPFTPRLEMSTRTDCIGKNVLRRQAIVRHSFREDRPQNLKTVIRIERTAMNKERFDWVMSGLNQHAFSKTEDRFLKSDRGISNVAKGRWVYWAGRNGIDDYSDLGKIGSLSGGAEGGKR